MGFLHFLKARTETPNRSRPSTGASSMAAGREGWERGVEQGLILTPLPPLNVINVANCRTCDLAGPDRSLEITNWITGAR